MNKKLSKTISVLTLIAVATFTSSESIMCYANAASTNEVSYRTNCINLYGDLNSDKRIDTFDFIQMREMVVKNEYSTLADLNRDEKVDGDDLTVLSDYVLGKGVLFDSYFYDDADEDKVCDLFEVAMLKTDPDSDDTDGDKISDYDEIVYSNTSPTDKYTRGLSVTDADDDYDDDKLTNAEEIAAGTDATSSDSDSDDVSDYDEIKVYNTDPNDDDTDDDNISDGDELKLGLKPDNDKSDGEVFDYDRTFAQTVKSDNGVFSSINTEENEYAVSIDINSAGIAEKSISLYIGEFANASEDENIIGKSVGFSYDENLKVDSAKVYFNLQETENVEKYMIFEFFPDTNYLLPVESKYTENAVYTETTQLGTYCLVKIDDTDSNNSRNGMNKTGVDILASENKIFNDTVLLDYELGETEVAFLVDISGSLDEEALEETKKSIHDFSQALFEHSENSYVTIFGYYQNPKGTPITFPEQYKDSEGLAILNTIDSVDNVLSELTMDKIYANKNNYLLSPINFINNVGSELFSSKCDNKYVFMLVDSTYSFDEIYENAVTVSEVSLLKSIYNKEINFNFIVSDDNYNNKKAVKNLKKVCDPLGFGVYSKSETGGFSVKSFAKIYSDAIIDLETLPGAYTCSLNFNSIPEMVERNAFINSLPKSYDRTKVPAADADGKINFKDAAVKVGAATLDGNGNLVFPSLYDACDMYDRTRLGFEQYMANKNISDMLISGAVKITPFNDKILYEDNDGDTIPNKNDPYPDEAFDDRFMIVNDNNFVPTIDFVEKHYNYGINCYNSKDDFFDEGIFAGFYAGRVLCYTSLLQLLQFENTEDKQMTDIYEKFDKFLNHYLVKNGKLMKISSEDMSDIILTQENNIEHFVYNVNAIKSCAEQVIKENDTINSKIISSTSGNNFMVACYDGPNCSHPKKYDNSDALDWGYSIGEALGGMTAEVCYNNGKYHMNLKYYLIDTYEFPYHWTVDDHEDTITIWAHGLHEAGFAKEYRIIGCLEQEYEWEKGEVLFEDFYDKKINLSSDTLNADPLY